MPSILQPFTDSYHILNEVYFKKYDSKNKKSPASKLPKLSGSWGVLLIHGFTSHTHAVDGLIPHLEKNHIPYERPILRGHSSHYRDLVGVTYSDWYADAEKALMKLSKKVDHICVVGLSMGGLVTLNLAAEHPKEVSSVVTAAAALKFANPLAPFSKWIGGLIKYWPSPSTIEDPQLRKACQNYKYFPTLSFASLYDYAKEVQKKLPLIHCPILILHSTQDHTISGHAANLLYNSVSSDYKEMFWFHRSGHDMLEDCEAEAVFEKTIDFIKQQKK